MNLLQTQPICLSPISSCADFMCCAFGALATSADFLCQAASGISLSSQRQERLCNARGGQEHLLARHPRRGVGTSQGVGSGPSIGGGTQPRRASSASLSTDMGGPRGVRRGAHLERERGIFPTPQCGSRPPPRCESSAARRFGGSTPRGPKSEARSFVPTSELAARKWTREFVPPARCLARKPAC